MTSNKVVELHPNEQVETEAGLWVAKVDRGLSEGEIEDLRAWLDAKTEHREVFLQFAELWDCMSSLSRLADLFPENSQVEAPQVKSSLWSFRSVAALCTVACLLGVAAFFYSSEPRKGSGLAEQVYETSVGEHSNVALIDGSRMVLNTDTRVSVLFNQKKRSIYLQRGELHVDVAHDPARPLSVVAGDKEFRAVGTAFNVQLDSEKIELIVTEGEVLVAERPKGKQNSTASVLSAGQSMSVSKGEKLILNPIETEARKLPVADIEADLAWRKGQLIFRGETLAVALKEISRYTNVEFTMDDEALASKRIAGLFNVGDVKSMLFALEEHFSIQHHYLNSEQVVLTSKEKTKREL